MIFKTVVLFNLPWKVMFKALLRIFADPALVTQWGTVDV